MSVSIAGAILTVGIIINTLKIICAWHVGSLKRKGLINMRIDSHERVLMQCQRAAAGKCNHVKSDSGCGHAGKHSFNKNCQVQTAYCPECTRTGELDKKRSTK